jgi:hypothetical protein
VIVAAKLMSLEEYLEYDDGTDDTYELVKGFYDEQVFVNEELIESPQFGKMDITANQVLMGI